MDQIELSEKTIRSISAFSERIMGYFYSGLLPLLVLSIEAPLFLKNIINSCGPLLTMVFSFGIGIGVYSIYFRIIGELIIFPFQHLIHFFFDSFRNINNSGSTIRILISYGVPIMKCRMAYQALKENFFVDDLHKELQISHGEIGVLYITSVIMFFSYFIILYINGFASFAYLYLSIGMFVPGLISDTIQHSKEAHLLKVYEENVIEFLRYYSYIKDNN